MTAQEAVGATRQALTTLAATVLRIRDEYGDTIGVRRLTSDVDRFAEALDQLGEPQPGHRAGVRSDEMIEIPEDPYDESMWQDAQSETQHAQ